MPNNDLPIELTGNPDDLVHIHRPGVSAVILTRTLDQSLRHTLSQLKPEDISSISLTASMPTIRRQLPGLLSDHDEEKAARLKPLISDCLELAEHFSHVVPEDSILNVSLRAIDHDACEKFHEDVLALRMIVTYRGATTEWLNPAAPAPAHAEPDRTSLGDVLLFRGTRYADAHTLALTHRSPAVERKDQWRFVFSLSVAQA